MDNDAKSKPNSVPASAQIVRCVGDYCRDMLSLQPGDRVLAAVSGGADSVALFHVMRALGYTLGIAHYDHQTRDGASARDAAFVRDLAIRFGVPGHFESADVATIAGTGRESFEMCARRLRYDFLLRTARSCGISYIATGHHADDQAETVLLRAVRGAGSAGIGGIPPERVEDAVRIVRPLLSIRRSELRAYVAENDLPFCTDITNEDTSYLRNRVRHMLIPVLEREYNPQIVTALGRLAETARVDNDCIEALAADAEARVIIGDAIDRAAFAALHVAIRRRVFQRYAWRLGVPCDYGRIIAGCAFVAEGRTGASFDLGTGIQLRNGAHTTEVAPIEPVAGIIDEVELPIPGATEAFARLFSVRRLAEIPAVPAAYCTTERQLFDADAVATLRVRRCRPGDRFTPLGMTGTRKLSDYLGELKLSPSERAAQLVLESNGTIVWVVGRAPSATASVMPSTRRVLEVEVRDADR